MSAKGGSGLGGYEFDRDQAAQQLFKGSGQTDPTEPIDQEQDQPKEASNTASGHASDPANVDVGQSSNSEGEDVTPTAGTAPAPPPKAPAEARVQFNNRIKPERRRVLDRYQREHNTTMQAIVDQMVDEYLDRRGLLPEDAD